VGAATDSWAAKDTPGSYRYRRQAQDRQNKTVFSWKIREQVASEMNLRLKLVLACGAALLVLSAVGVFSYRLAERSDRDQHWVTHTHDVLGQLDALDFDLKPPVNLDGAQKSIASLVSLTADNPVQRRSLQRLGELIPVQSFPDTLRVQGAAFQARLNRQAEPIATRMKQEEERLRTLRLSAMQASSQQIKFEVVLGTT
jgi:CHASE3 domain sensor protein